MFSRYFSYPSSLGDILSMFPRFKQCLWHECINMHMLVQVEGSTTGKSRTPCQKSYTEIPRNPEIQSSNCKLYAIITSCTNKSLTLLLYLECTADQLLRVQKLVDGLTWITSCSSTQQLFFYCTEIMEMLVSSSFRLFFCLQFLSVYVLEACNFLCVEFACIQQHTTSCDYLQFSHTSTKLSEQLQAAYLTSVDGNLTCRGPLSKV